MKELCLSLLLPSAPSLPHLTQCIQSSAGSARSLTCSLSSAPFSTWNLLGERGRKNVTLRKSPEPWGKASETLRKEQPRGGLKNTLSSGQGDWKTHFCLDKGISSQSMGFEITWPGFQSGFWHFLLGWPWKRSRHLSSQSLFSCWSTVVD